MAIFVVFKSLPAAAMAIFPFIFVKEASYKNDSVLLNHELIHFRQQLELLIIPFYFLYLFHYLINLIKYKSTRLAYLNIVFEKEAYEKEHTYDYLETRKIFAWYKWLKA